jgi:hypothetical protein
MIGSMGDPNLLTFVKRILDAYEGIELSAAPHSYFIAVDREQISERIKKTDIEKIIQETKNLWGFGANELASLLFMPGSSLPKLKSDEVEIARISVSTTIGNCYSLRAEWDEDIIYRIVSEIDSLEIDVPIKNSKTPLTLKDVILQFECAVPAVGLNDLAYEMLEGDHSIDYEQYLFAESAFYAGFGQFYRFASKKLIESDRDIL